MKSRRLVLTAVVLIAAAVAAGVAWDRLHIQPAPLNAAEPAAKNKPKVEGDKDRAADRDALRADFKDFVATFNKGDAKALAHLWTEEGEFISGDGATLHGRAALVKGYTQFFEKNPKVQLEFKIDSVHFVSHDGAFMEGTARTHKHAKPGEPASSHVSALFQRENGHWRLAMLREWPEEGAALRDVDWLIGSWEAKNANVDVRTTYQWEEGKTFIRAHFTVKGIDNDSIMTGTQLIGKDPRTGLLHSWMFESDGGFGEAVWNWDGKQWRIDADGVEQDGSETTATNLLTPLDKNSFTWQSIDRTEGDEAASNIPPVKVVRVK